MVKLDERRHLIVSTASHYFGVPNDEDLAVTSTPEVDKFLDEPTCRTLCAQPRQSDVLGLKLTFELPSRGGNTLVFFKVTSAAVTEENFHDLVQVATTGGVTRRGSSEGGENSALVSALRLVWGPALQRAGVSGNLLWKLEESLVGPRLSVNVVEEQTAWERRASDAKSSEERRIALEAAGILKRARVELDRIAASREGLEGAEDALEAVAGYVDDLWKLEGAAYSEERTRSLLVVIGNEVVSIVQALVDAKGLPAGDGPQVKDEAVSTGATLCEKWSLSCERLTGLFWPHQSLHPWKGSVHTPQRCARMAKRLRLLAELRAQHRQLIRLLTPSERNALGAEHLLRAFDEVQGLGADENEAAWEQAKRNVEESLRPAEERVAGKLRAQFSGVRGPTELVAEFRRYGELLKRDALRRALRAERETLLSAIGNLVESCQVGPDTSRLLDSPQILQDIQATRTAELRLEGLKKLVKELLSDLPGYDNAAATITSALKEATARRQELIDSWTNEIRSAVISKELSLDADGAVVELTGTSMMRVTYDPRLMQLVREVRALAGQGIELPREIGVLAERAGALASRARALQQVATFHNTIGDRMVPSQRPLMLVAALELARAVREQSGVAWNDPKRVDAYTARLRELVRKFARQNSELTSKHFALSERVASLLRGEGVNLASNQSGWKETLRSMRATVDAVEGEYGNTKAWKLHWDRQLLKALGVAYRAALPSLLQKLPEVRVELVFREGRLQWRPPIEEVRAKLYSGLRRFLAIPMNFRGVGDTAEGQFGGLVRRSAYLFGRVYVEAETVVSAMETMRLKWAPLAAPARIDPGERLKGHPPIEWERAFKDAKQWAQEVGRLRGSEVRLWCIRADTGTARGDLESTTRRCWERLSVDLRTEASSRLVAIVEFLSSASKELDRRPRSVEEVGVAREAYARIRDDASGIGKELDDVTGLARVLAAWTRERLEGVSGARAGWDGLADRLERHKAVIARQIEDAKLNLRHKYIALRDDRERWDARWSARPEVLEAEWLATTRERWIALRETKSELNDECQYLGLKVKELGDDLEASEVQDKDGVSLSDQIEAELEAMEMSCRVQNEFMEELAKQEAEEWTVARRRFSRFQDWLDSWEARLRGPDRVSAGRETFVEKKVHEVRAALEWAQYVRSDDLVDEHWAELAEILNLPTRRIQDVTLGHLLSVAPVISEKIDLIKGVTKRAAAESGIRQALVELESWEGSASLPLQTIKTSQGTSVHTVVEYAGLLARAGELRLLLEGARGSSCYERFAARAVRWEAALSELEERVRILSAVQRKWIYLEPIFGGGAAPNESTKWIRADKEFRYLMTEISRDPRVPALRRLPLPSLTDIKDALDRCQRSLDEFLEEKRAAYPRLYFLSDEDLLELVSGGRGLETHLPKLYPGVGGAVTEGNFLKAVKSPEGELLKLPRDVDLTEPLPEWLAALEAGMRDALRVSLDECLIDSAADPSRYPAQILLLSERIRFTERCERAMREGTVSLKNLVEALEAQRARYRGLEDVGDRLTALKARGLLLDVVYHLGVVRALLSSTSIGTGSVAKVAWVWNRQLRTYKGTANGATPIIRCAGAEFPYCFEYQGATVGLVRTPLTERCFLALTQAMKLGLGGSPTGPAGTGKTESVKALGAILGRLVLVFNCDEGMDAGSVRRILGGLAQSGAWGCFDEFNRLKEETLSAVSMLVGPLQESVRDGIGQVQFGNERVKLDPHCCIFITMNPAGAEYGGRHRLPDSLARLFRPVAMAHPDRLDIAGSLLECAGFLEARTLAKQLVETLDLAEKLLSKQPHYDWGLRALKSVLEAVHHSSGKRTMGEAMRLLEGLRIAIMPKLTETDSTKFSSLLSDVFPKENHKRTRSSSSSSVPNSVELYAALKSVCEVAGLSEEVAERCIQLDQQLQARTGVAVVGPPGCGKTLLRKTLASAMGRIGIPLTQILVYPGAVTKAMLLGRVDPQTREWKEGLLSGNVASAGDVPTWIVLDGDVEPGWAEALNSALDDNRLLTLPNGVGVRLGAATRFIFETHQLDGASPATVSRLGVIHLGTVPATTLLSSSRLEPLQSEARDIALTNLPTGIGVVLKTNAHHSSVSGLVSAALVHLVTARTRTMAVLGLVRSLSGEIEDTVSRDNLARLLYEITDCRCPDSKKPCAAVYDPERDRLEPPDDVVAHFETDDGPISLSGSVKIALAAVSPWIESGHPVLLRGSPGSGKSSIIAVALASLRDVRGGDSVVRGSSLHGPEELVARLKRACIQVDTSSSHGRTYRPRSGRRLILLLEDIHLGSKNLQELARQLLQEGGFYEDDLEFAKLPVTVICTADLTTPLHPRLEALLATHHIPRPRSRELLAIIELHLRFTLKRNGGDRVAADSWIPRIATAMLEAARGLASSEKKWTARELAAWADALEFYPTPEDPLEGIQHTVDAARRLFSARLSPKERLALESSVLARFPEARGTWDDVYAWRGLRTGVGLVPFSPEQWRQEVETSVARCVREGHPVEAELTLQFLQLVAGATWALGRSQRGQGGLALVGRPGAGRRTAARLAAVLSSFNLIDAAPGRGRLAVKAAVQTAGVDGEPTLLLLEEHHLREEGTAILVAALLDKGEIPGLVGPEELDGMIVPLGELARREDFAGTLEQYLQHRLKRLLRIAMILDEGSISEERMTRSGVLRHCVVLGGDRWWTSKGALTELAVRRYADQDQDQEIEIVVEAHLAVAESEHQAPASFLALLHSYDSLRRQWMENVEQQIASLEAGIGRLEEAGERVAKLQEEASKQREELEIEKGKAASALEQITATMRGATGQREEMTNLKAETERESAEVARRKGDIEAELGRVEPLVAEAAQAVAGIGADALAEVRSLRAPPAPVRDVLEGVLRLMGIRDTSWNSMKTFLAKRGMKDDLRTWDARRSSSSSLDAVEKLVTERPESFEEKTARRVSVAAAPLATWVLANLRYGQVLRDVAPLEREQRMLAERLSAAEAQLGRLAAGLNSVEGRVGQLQQELAEHSRGVAALQLRAESTETSLAAAQGLLQGLDAEHRDWQKQHHHLIERKTRLAKEAASAATLLVYQGSRERRDEEKIAVELLTTESERLSWRAQGLPVDSDSLVGAVRALKGPLIPLFLDPSGVAVAWLKSNQATGGLEVTRPVDPRFLTTLELAVRFGKPLLVEEIDTLPAVLLPLLRRGQLRLGDRVLAAQPGFRLFLATRKESLVRGEDLPREAVVAQVVLGAGRASLAERLVERALLKETPGLEEARKVALEREERLASERDTARVDLLAQLGAARGQEILIGEKAAGRGLLGSLEATQAKAKEIARALEESRRSLEEVTRRAEKHTAFATFAAGIFEAVKELPSLGPLYVFSVDEFIDIYLRALNSRDVVTAGDRESERHIDQMRRKRLVALTLQHCAKAAYRKHRLPLALHLVLALSDDVPVAEKGLLLSNTTTSGSGVAVIPEWVPEERKSAVTTLMTVKPQIGSKLSPVWLSDVTKIFADPTLTPLQKVLVVRALRPDYLHTALSKMAASQLGVRDIAPPALSLAKGDWGERPVLLLLSPGADPGPELRAIAANSQTTFMEVSLGQGQLKQAEAALEDACREGGWVLLSNLQLALNWLPRLDCLLRSPACTTDRHPKTRVWLTTEECLSGFYPGLAALCAKLAYEPPEGVKRNVKRSLHQLRQQQQESGDTAEALLLAWLHATLQERRRFVPQGWIKAYEWSETDLEAAMKLLAGMASMGDWEGGRGLLDTAVYGGRLQDAYDARALQAILSDIWAGDVYSGRRGLGGVLTVSEVSGQHDRTTRLLQAIDELPDHDPPSDYFGLPANADRAWERAAAESALLMLRGMTAKPISLGSGDEEQTEGTVGSESVRKLLDELEKVHRSKDNGNSETNPTEKIDEDPLNEFFAHERKSALKLLRRVLRDLQGSDFKFGNSMTPKNWLEHWPTGPLEFVPFAWKALERPRALATPNRVDLCVLSKPEAFFAALKQRTARKTGSSIEELLLRADWSDTNSNRDEGSRWGIVLEGLLLTGASIRDGRLTEVNADEAPVLTTPRCHVSYWVGGSEESALGRTSLEFSVDVPLYTDMRRNRLISALPVTCHRETREVWLRRGVALHLTASSVEGRL